MAGIITENIHHSYTPGVEVLKGVGFEAPEGCVTGFLGPNGVGKTTLMKILTGSLTGWTGRATLDGIDVREDRRSVGRIVGYLPENNPLYTDLYVREYLAFVGRLYGLRAKALNAAVERVIEQTGLGREAHKKAGQLSKGYRQRVGLAAALVHDPKVLILDEPTTGLDPNQLVDIRSLIKALGREKTVLLSTHIMQEVEAMCGKVVILSGGTIVSDKSIAQVENAEEEPRYVYLVETDRTGEIIERIRNIEDVESVELTNKGAAKITARKDVRSAVFDLVVRSGQSLKTLTEQAESLEERFRHLTHEGK